MMERGARDVAGRGVKVVANAGGVNPEACREAVSAALSRANPGRSARIGVVAGDDILPRIDELIDRGNQFTSIDTGQPLSAVRDRIQSANVYLGAFPIVEALRQGADVVITGRCADAALSMAPTIAEFGWKADDWDRIAGGVVAGHAIECGAQCTGGNCQAEWKTIGDFAHIGYPVLEAFEDGAAVVTKHPGTGGRVSVASVTEQLVYEIGDPRCYITPDCVADFASVRLEQDGPDRVRISGAKGRPATDSYKVSISYAWGWKAVGYLAYAWPDAYEKARLGDRILRDRLASLGLEFEAIHTEFIGANACHGEALSGPVPADLAEVMLRVGVRSPNKAAVDRFTKEIAPLALNGPPGVTYVGGRPKVEEVVAYWPALIAKSEIQPVVTVKEI
jgi:hypothetical protein